MPGGKLEKKNSLASLFPLAVRVHLASVKGARNTEKNRARVEARLSGGELEVCLDKRGAATFFKDGQEVVFRRPGAVAESTQTESDSEETTSPDESSIEDVLKGGEPGTPEVNASMEMNAEPLRGDKTFEGAGGGGVGIENNAEVVIEATGLDRNDSSIVDTGYLTDEEDLAENKAEVVKQTLNEEIADDGGKKNTSASKSLGTAGSKEKSVGGTSNVGKKVSHDVGKVARVPKNTVRRGKGVGKGGGGGSKQSRVNPRAVKAHHSGWKVFKIVHLGSC